MSGDVVSLAGELMPYVTAAAGAYGSAVLTRVRDDAADATVGLGRRLLQRVFGSRNVGEPLPEPLADLAASPQDEDALAAVRLAIRKALAADTALEAEVRSMLGRQNVTQLVHASGDAYTAGRDNFVVGGDYVIHFNDPTSSSSDKRKDSESTRVDAARAFDLGWLILYIVITVTDRVPDLFRRIEGHVLELDLRLPPGWQETLRMKEATAVHDLIQAFANQITAEHPNLLVYYEAGVNVVMAVAADSEAVIESAILGLNLPENITRPEGGVRERVDRVHHYFMSILYGLPETPDSEPLGPGHDDELGETVAARAFMLGWLLCYVTFVVNKTQTVELAEIRVHALKLGVQLPPAWRGVVQQLATEKMRYLLEGVGIQIEAKHPRVATYYWAALNIFLSVARGNEAALRESIAELPLPDDIARADGDLTDQAERVRLYFVSALGEERFG